MRRFAACTTMPAAMSADVIVSYDGTSNDEDALVLGKLLAQGGARLALAYVRHHQESDPGREEIAQHDAEQMLERGALALDGSHPDCHVVLDRSTPAGLRRLAEEQGASVIVFGSDYRTSPGRAEPGTSAEVLLAGGPVTIAVAEAGLRVKEASLNSIALSPPPGDPAAEEAAEALAAKLGASIVDPSQGADLIIVPSRSGGAQGHIDLSGAARNQLNSARGSVLVVPCGAPPQL
jgi:nucleotide-binding universal stress UspA family protein